MAFLPLKSCHLLAFCFLASWASFSSAAGSPARMGLNIGAHSSRRLLQETGATAIIPWFLDQSPCASFNTEDASPMLGPEGSALGWVTLQQGGIDDNGTATLQVDLTAHIANLFLADTSTTRSDFSNVRSCFMTELPNACPATNQVMFHAGKQAPCDQRRATLGFMVPPSIFNCSYRNKVAFTTSFYLQLDVDLASDVCRKPEQRTFAGTRNASRMISPTCSYITVIARCEPSTCTIPLLAENEMGALGGGSGATRKLTPLITGIVVGTVVLIAAVFAGVAYTRKRARDDALRRKLAYIESGGTPSDLTPLSSDAEDELELDFSGKSTTALAAIAHKSMVMLPYPSPGSMTSPTRSVLFRGPRSMVMPRTARGSVTMPGGMGMYSPAAAHASMSMFSSPMAAAGASPGSIIGLGSPMSVLHMHENLAAEGAKRFSDKYDTTHVPEASSSLPVVAGASPASPALGSYDNNTASTSAYPIARMSARLSATAGQSAATPARSLPSPALAVTGLGSQFSPESEIEPSRTSPTQPYRMVSFAMAASAAGARAGHMGSADRPSPAGARGLRVAPRHASVMSVVPQGHVMYGEDEERAVTTVRQETGHEAASAYMNPLAMMGDSSSDEAMASDGMQTPPRRTGSSTTRRGAATPPRTGSVTMRTWRTPGVVAQAAAASAGARRGSTRDAYATGMSSADESGGDDVLVPSARRRPASSPSASVSQVMSQYTPGMLLAGRFSTVAEETGLLAGCVDPVHPVPHPPAPVQEDDGAMRVTWADWARQMREQAEAASSAKAVEEEEALALATFQVDPEAAGEDLLAAVAREKSMRSTLPPDLDPAALLHEASAPGAVAAATSLLLARRTAGGAAAGLPPLPEEGRGSDAGGGAEAAALPPLLEEDRGSAATGGLSGGTDGQRSGGQASGAGARPRGGWPSLSGGVQHPTLSGGGPSLAEGVQPPSPAEGGPSLSGDGGQPPSQSGDM